MIWLRRRSFSTAALTIASTIALPKKMMIHSRWVTRRPVPSPATGESGVSATLPGCPVAVSSGGLGEVVERGGDLQQECPFGLSDIGDRLLAASFGFFPQTLLFHTRPYRRSECIPAQVGRGWPAPSHPSGPPAGIHRNAFKNDETVMANGVLRPDGLPLPDLASGDPDSSLLWRGWALGPGGPLGRSLGVQEQSGRGKYRASAFQPLRRGRGYRRRGSRPRPCGAGRQQVDLGLLTLARS